MSYGLLLLRIVVGLTMASHGAQKLFGWFGGYGLKGTAGFFGDALGYRAAPLMALLAALAETSGVLFALGLVTPLAALGITVVMLNAILAVHWKNGFFNGDGGIEFPLVLATTAIAVAATGPGRYSIDRALHWDDNITGAKWALGVAIAAAIISVLTTTLGRKPQPADQQPAA